MKQERSERRPRELGGNGRRCRFIHRSVHRPEHLRDGRRRLPTLLLREGEIRTGLHERLADWGHAGIRDDHRRMDQLLPIGRRQVAQHLTAVHPPQEVIQQDEIGRRPASARHSASKVPRNSSALTNDRTSSAARTASGKLRRSSRDWQDCRRGPRRGTRVPFGNSSASARALVFTQAG